MLIRSSQTTQNQRNAMEKADINRPADASQDELEKINELEEKARTQVRVDWQEVIRELWP